MELLLIFAVFCAVIKSYRYERITNYFPGKKFVYVYNNFKAIVIIDKSIEIKSGFIYYEDLIVSGQKLAKACAVGMHVSNELWEENDFPKIYKKEEKIKEFVILFLNKKNFNYSAEVVGYKVDEALAFATKLTVEYPYDGPYASVVNATELKRNEIWAVAVIHEYLHCMSSFYLKDWDYRHELWEKAVKDIEEKNIGKKAAEQTYIILNLN